MQKEFSYHFTIGIYRGINKTAFMSSVTLHEAEYFLRHRTLDGEEHWTIYCHEDKDYYTHEQIMELFGQAPPQGINPQYQEVRKLLDGARESLALARSKYDRKKKAILQNVQADTPNLFGERASGQGAQLFDERVDPSAIPTALEPFQREIKSWEREVATLEGTLRSMEGQTVNTLFDLLNN